VITVARMKLFAQSEAFFLSAGLVAANLVAWAMAFSVFHDQPMLLGTALLAWGLGLRHAVDADHIAAIDGVTRKLVQAGQKPIAVGLFFALGHSSVVVLASMMVAATATHLAKQSGLAESPGQVGEIGAVIGSSVSIVVLLVVAAANATILHTVWRTILAVRAGGSVPAQDLGGMLQGRGPLAMLCRPLFRLIGQSWHMVPLGFAFGLGFDTAASVALLGVSATQAVPGIPVWSIMIFPLLFTAGMALVDTLDGILMLRACDWAFVSPMRKLGYNFTITAISVTAALAVAAVEILQVIGEHVGHIGALGDISSFVGDHLDIVGIALIGIFGAIWLGSRATSRFRVATGRA
jgi:high-affinity nickel-transport protein